VLKIAELKRSMSREERQIGPVEAMMVSTPDMLWTKESQRTSGREGRKDDELSEEVVRWQKVRRCSHAVETVVGSGSSDAAADIATRVENVRLAVGRRKKERRGRTFRRLDRSLPSQRARLLLRSIRQG
jgi:hypothetical protein